MIEDYGLCTHFRYHRQKLVYFLEAMRSHRDLLRAKGFTVSYFEIDVSDKSSSFFERLALVVHREKITVLTSFAIEDKFFRHALSDFCVRHNLSWMVIESPLFLNDEQEILKAVPDKNPLMKKFYEAERKKRNILMTHTNAPAGRRFSFDNENRLRLPKEIQVPSVPVFAPSVHRKDVIKLVKKHFHDHPGALSPWLPSTREQAQLSLRKFLSERLENFGPYENAMSVLPFFFTQCYRRY